MVKIEYGTEIYDSNVILDSDYVEKITLLGDALEADMLTFTVYSETAIEDKGYGYPVKIYLDDILRDQFYLINLEKTGILSYQFSCVSAIGLLANMVDYGGFYEKRFVGTLGEEIGVIDEIFSGTNIDYTIQANVAQNIVASAYLPIASKRDNLHQVLFVCGASILKDEQGVLNIVYNKPKKNDAKDIDSDLIYSSGSEVLPTPPSKITIREHLYYADDAIVAEMVYNSQGEAVVEKAILFDEPLHSLSTTGTLQIIESNANHAIVSGSGTLSGKKYIHSQQDRTWINPEPALESKELTIGDDVSLITYLNSENILERMVNYYSNAKEIQCDFVLSNQKCGDIINFYNPVAKYDEGQISGYIKSMDINISNTTKSSAVIITNWEPTSPGNAFNNFDLLTTNGSWTVPEEVEKIRVILGSGGYGGNGGANGANGTGANPLFNKWGNAGDGGAGGAGGSGGKVHSVDIEVTAGDVLTYTIGAGGAGGASASVGAEGGASTITHAGTTYSSAEGTVLAEGYFNILDTKWYSIPNPESGVAGGKGIDVNQNGTNVTFNGQTWTPGANGKHVSGYKEGKAYGGGGGGPAVGSNGGAGTNGRTEANKGSGYNYGGSGGRGATAINRTEIPTIYGQGGVGGHGGGGGGGAGACEGNPSYMEGGENGAGGKGGKGGVGASGYLIIYY